MTPTIKRTHFLLLLLALATVIRAGVVGQTTTSKTSPIADSAAVVVSGDMRFTVLTPEMIRIEWRSGSTKKFEDHATFTVINRLLPVPHYEVTEDNTFLYITTNKLKLQYRKGSFPGTFNPASSQNLMITFAMDGHTVVWYPWKKDALNLKGTCRTLDGANGDNKRSELEDGIISRSGWSVIDDSNSAKRGDGSRSMLLVPDDETGIDWFAEREDPAGMDWYFMGYGHNYKQALHDYTLISGKIPMPPLWALGYWYSKYQDYSAQQFRELAQEMRDNDLPCDVMVIDTDWHGQDWTGWSWNRNQFPDPATFLKNLHEKDSLKVTLNLHPAYGVASDEDNFAAFKDGLAGEITPDASGTIPWRLDNRKFYKSLFTNILRPHENIGTDFWWLDWQQELTSKYVPELSNTFWCNHVFYEDMRKNHPDCRAFIFHRWGGLGNHRYQIGFSGDALINYPTLAFEPYFTATASNVGYCWWGHDLGGHAFTSENIVNDQELVLRWIQFGVFTPIFRTHATNDPRIERRIWKFANFPTMREAVNLRYSLVPYIYTMGRKAYDEGIGICRPLYYDNPDVEEAYTNEGEYMFGDDILVYPITKPSVNGKASLKVWLPEGDWFEACTGERLSGGKSYTRTFGMEDIPYYYKAGAIIPNYPKVKNLKTRPENLVLKVVPGANGEAKLYEDENDTEGYRSDKYSFSRMSQTTDGGVTTLTIHPIEGTFPGMPESRSYTVQLLYADCPATVSVNGTAYAMENQGGQGTWSYDAATHTTTIRIPKTSCSERLTVEVGAQSTAIAWSTTEDDNRMIYARTADELRVVFSEPQPRVALNVYNASGSRMARKSYRNVAQVAYPTTHLSSGLYVCQYTFSDKTRTAEFVK